ncbi:MAG TPA: threonine/serine dehydratase [Vicinamibacteria bacterium]|nr:threonine/serine dehydratase [Vicinamibacteria bacterium]
METVMRVEMGATGQPARGGAVAPIDRPAIERVYEVIKPHIRVTPVLVADGRDFALSSFPLTVKLEHLQHAGSFKTRGAFSNLLLRDIPDVGVVAASGGNHGAAVAYAAMRCGIPAKIFVPTVCSPAKIERIRRCGAALAVTGARYADALAASETWSAQTGALPVHAFDQAETLLGQGTVGLELSQQAPGLDTILVPVGGGGLIAGIAAWYAGRARIVGVEPDGAPTLSSALQAGRPVDAAAGSVAADSLAPRRVGDLTFPIAQARVESVVLVSDDAIRLAQRALWDVARLVAEPGGAAAFAALQSGAYKPGVGERVGIIISGGNAHLDFPGSLTGPAAPNSRP